MIIREAVVSDAAQIALLGRITFDETFGHLFEDRTVLVNYFEKTFSVEKIRTSIQKENSVFWIAFVEELPVGYAKLKLQSPSEFIQSENVCQLQKIYVLKDFLSMKIGLHLQNALMERAKNSGSDSIWLSALASNKRAINFYLKNGFSEIGEHDFQIGKYHFDFIAMSKKF